MRGFVLIGCLAYFWGLVFLTAGVVSVGHMVQDRVVLIFG